ncbi:MAG TPA: RNA-binding S4 domain-containing protein [Bacteroidia bacterium]|jgi:ribosome-associated protein|nr:RNA-binding S4 domain-containing protein [Bacteroidia bacterium]
MNTFKIKGEFIQLNQLIKAMGWTENGAAANSLIDAGQVKVNGNVEYRKRNKLVPGDKINFKNEQVTIE